MKWLIKILPFWLFSEQSSFIKFSTIILLQSENNGSETKDNSEENNNSVNNIIDEEDRKYILYNLFYGNKENRFL